MNYKEFVKKYRDASNKEAFLKKHIVKTYLPYATKIAEAKEIVKITCYKEINGKEMFSQDSPSFFALFMMRVISNYTDIEYENGLEAYDAIAEAGAFENIILAIPPKEYDTFSTVLQMVKDDEMENYRSLAGILDTKIEAINLALNTMLETISKLEIKSEEG